MPPRHLKALLPAALACFAACSAKPPAPSRPAADSKFPGFAGRVGQLEDGNNFLTFIHTHQDQTVALDLQFPADSYQGTEDSDASSFDVWEECDDLPEGASPGPLAGGCTGFEFLVPYKPGAPRMPAHDATGQWRLRGEYSVKPAGGPLQGLVVIRLDPPTGTHPTGANQ